MGQSRPYFKTEKNRSQQCEEALAWVEEERQCMVAEGCDERVRFSRPSPTPNPTTSNEKALGSGTEIGVPGPVKLT